MSLPRMLGRYEVVSRLATGGMAEILLGRLRGPAGFHRTVVLKRVLPHLAEDAGFRAMFVDEAGIVAGLRHGNVVHVHELGEQDGELFLVLEYLAGESVGGLMRGLAHARRPLPLVLAAHVAAEAAAGLHAAHELCDEQGRPRHVVHRDVSPQNLFVTYDGDVKVLDFGVAKARSRLTRTHTGQAKGKFGYMSPEQCRREDVDRRTDVFALGVVLHELITGRRLFPDASELAVVRAICDDPVPLPSSLRPDCPDSLDRICMRALEKEPIDRYGTADALRLDLIRAARELDPELVPRDALAGLMHELFAAQIEEKEAVVRSPSEAPPPPAQPATTGVSLPTRRGGLWVAGVAAAALAAAVVAAALTTPSEPAAEPEPGRAQAAPTAEAPEVAVWIGSTPAGASVTVGEEEVGETPVRLRLPRGDAPVMLTLRKEGHATEVRRITPDVPEQRIEVELAPAGGEPVVGDGTAREDRRQGEGDTAEPRPPPEKRRNGSKRQFYLFE